MKNFWWAKHKFWLGLACSAIFLFLAFRNVQWVELGAVLQSLDWSYLLVATVLYVLHLVVRGQRWQVLLAPLGHLTVRDAFAYVNIGYMANNLLPLRAGEVIRAVLLGEKKGISKSAVLATVVVERLLDILSLTALIVILMLAMPIPPLVKQTAVAFGGVSCLAAAGLWWAAGHPFTADTQRSESSPESERGRYLVGSKPTGLLQKVLRLCRSFVGGLAALRSPGQAGAAVGYSALVWGLAVGSTWLVLGSCGLDLRWTAALMVVGVVNFGAAIPSAPGSVGVVHFLAVLALEPWAVEQSTALGFAIVYHAMAFLITVGLGIVYMGLESTSFREFLKLTSSRPQGKDCTTI